MKTYSSYQTDIARIINNTLPDNLTWANEMINDTTRYLVSKYYFNERTYTVPNGTGSGTQFYNLPPQVKKLINVTVLVGNVLRQPKECSSREQWDYLNTVQFNQDYPSFFFVYNGQMGLFPIPSSSGNVLKMNYKTRIPELSMSDVTGTCTIITNTTTVTASAGTPFLNWMAGNWIKVATSSTNATNGDGQWYQIDSVTNSTTLILKNAYTGATVTGGSFTIGEVSLLPEDYQDLPLYRMGIIYYTTRFPDAERAAQYQKLYDTGFAALDEEYGAKTTSVVLSDTIGITENMNLYQSGISQA
jgi:hypothetical protein